MDLLGKWTFIWKLSREASLRFVYPVLCIKIRFVTRGIYEEQLPPKCLVGGLLEVIFQIWDLLGRIRCAPRNSITVFGALKSPALPTLAPDLHLHAAGTGLPAPPPLPFWSQLMFLDVGLVPDTKVQFRNMLFCSCSHLPTISTS